MLFSKFKKPVWACWFGHSHTVLINTCIVLTYDGRNPIHLSHFKSLPRIDTELCVNSTVLVTFFLGAYNLTNGGALNIGVNLGISNNVQSVILLVDSHPYTPSF
jgi:hypothetical protein